MPRDLARGDGHIVNPAHHPEQSGGRKSIRMRECIGETRVEWSVSVSLRDRIRIDERERERERERNFREKLNAPHEILYLPGIYMSDSKLIPAK